MPYAALFLVSLVALLAGGAEAVLAQSALDGFDPRANSTVQIVVPQPDGKILIGGEFTALSPNGGPLVTRNRIARLNADGTLDIAFNPDANNSVYAIAVQADGKILVGGTFTAVGGQTRDRIARLDATTGVADSWNPNADGSVHDIAVQTDGKILAVGFFSNIGGQARNRIARLDPTTSLADSFNPNSSGVFISAIALQRDGKILVAGLISSIGGGQRNNIARLDPVTGLVDSFNPPTIGGGNTIYAIAVQADGKILVGGRFSGTNGMGGPTRNYLARLDASTGVPDSFDPNANNTVWSIVVQADGKILVGGGFTSIGGAPRTRIARLDPTTGMADPFNPNHPSWVYSIAVQADGKILIGGDPGPSIARLEADGRADQTLDLSVVGAPAPVAAIATQPDGRVLIGGQFSSVLGVPRNNLARLNTDGTLDPAFDPNANGLVSSLVVQADGNILVGGGFTTIGGAERDHLARLDGTTGMADSFDPNASDGVTAMVIDSGGRILVGGKFSTIGGQARRGIARLDPKTGLADDFNPNPDSDVGSIALQSDGKILVAGEFFSIGSQPRRFLARLDPSTGLADSFNPNPNGWVGPIVVQADGKILVGGNFNQSVGMSTIGGETRNYIARLDPATGLADSFNPNADQIVRSVVRQADGRILVGGTFRAIGGEARHYIARLDSATGSADSFNPNADQDVFSIALQADGKILVAGVFNTIGGESRGSFARLTSDIAAQQNLAITRTRVEWARAGSSPQFDRVSFEFSTDNTTYTPIGNGTSSGSDWTLDGLNFPTGVNFWVRARGHYRSGGNNFSESAIESVRNAFVPPPPIPVAVVSRKVHGSAGTFDIDLPLAGASGVECRSGGATDEYQVVTLFGGPVTFQSATVTSGSGSVIAATGSGSSTATVNLTGASGGQTLEFTLLGVNDGTNIGDLVVRMSVLAGDVNSSRAVNAGDIGQTKAQAGQPVGASNFREDLNADGFINASDIGLVKSRSGMSLTGAPIPGRKVVER